VEPEILRRGNQFHREVQAAWAGEIAGAPIHAEHGLFLHHGSHPTVHQRRGRIDLFIDQLDDFVSIIEIKSTDWDTISAKNRRKLLGAHCRQVLRYVDEYLTHDRENVCAAILYPHAPANNDIQTAVEDYLNDQGLQVAWYHEGSTPDASPKNDETARIARSSATPVGTG
jgi:hypothetical protein